MRVVRFAGEKWPGTPHWQFDARGLGADEHGQWLGVPEGEWLSRPGAGFAAQCDQVMLLPHDDWWVATFYGDDRARPVDIYVDITTPVSWADDVVGCFDLDLDVIRGTTGRVWVDDEDEFALHRRELDYPEEMAAHAVAACARVLTMVEGGAVPFDGATSGGWLARFRSQLRA